MYSVEQSRWNEMVSRHWWIRGHHLIIRTIIRQSLSSVKTPDTRCLDVGCSGGYFFDFLSGFGKVYGFDISLDGLPFHNINRSKIIQADAVRIPFRNESFDVVTLLEVAEHIDDDYALLKEVYRVCRRSALVFVMVPAHRLLWGSHDVKYFHKRRYSKIEFLELIKSCHFTIRRFTYMHPHLLFPLFFIRLCDRVFNKKLGDRDDFLSLGSFFDRILQQTMLWENSLVKRYDFPFGTTIFSVLEKK